MSSRLACIAMAVAIVGAFAVPASAQAPALSLSATLGQGYRDGERAMTVTAQGIAPSDGTRLYVHYDQEVEECPAGHPEDMLGEGTWVMPSPGGAPFRRLDAGAFVEDEQIFVQQGPARLCGYLVQDDEIGEPLPPLVVAPVLTRVERDPSIGLDRPTVVATLLASRRVHRDVRKWINQGEKFDEEGVGVNGPGYIRFREITGDGLADAIVQVSAGGVGRPHAYYVVTEHGGVARVVMSVRKAFEASIQVRGRTLTETIPVYAPSDAMCCASRLAIRKFRWNGQRFVVISRRRLVRTRFYEPPVKQLPRPEPRPRPEPEPEPERPEQPRGNCDPNYRGACIPPYPPDLDCDDIPATDFARVGSDPHGFDGDGDGVACES